MLAGHLNGIERLQDGAIAGPHNWLQRRFQESGQVKIA